MSTIHIQISRTAAIVAGRSVWSDALGDPKAEGDISSLTLEERDAVARHIGDAPGGGMPRLCSPAGVEWSSPDLAAAARSLVVYEAERREAAERAAAEREATVLAYLAGGEDWPCAAWDDPRVKAELARRDSITSEERRAVASAASAALRAAEAAATVAAERYCADSSAPDPGVKDITGEALRRVNSERARRARLPHRTAVAARLRQLGVDDPRLSVADERRPLGALPDAEAEEALCGAVVAAARAQLGSPEVFRDVAEWLELDDLPGHEDEDECDCSERGDDGPDHETTKLEEPRTMGRDLFDSLTATRSALEIAQLPAGAMYLHRERRCRHCAWLTTHALCVELPIGVSGLLADLWIAL
jgi:hypothetical protein